MMLRTTVILFFLLHWAGVTYTGQDSKKADIVIIITNEGLKSKYIEESLFLKGKKDQAEVEVKVGQKVMWKNTDKKMPHTATSEKEGIFNTEDIKKDGGTKIVLFDQDLYKRAGGKPGEFVRIPYLCDYHQEMKGVIKLIDKK